MDAPFDQITHNSDLNFLIRSESTTVLAEEYVAIVLCSDESPSLGWWLSLPLDHITSGIGSGKEGEVTSLQDLILDRKLK